MNDREHCQNCRGWTRYEGDKKYCPVCDNTGFKRRHPSEILAVVDSAQQLLDDLAPGDFELRDLMWEILEDVLTTTEALCTVHTTNSAGAILDTRVEPPYQGIRDYLINYYGDD